MDGGSKMFSISVAFGEKNMARISPKKMPGFGNFWCFFGHFGSLLFFLGHFGPKLGLSGVIFGNLF